MPDRGARGLLHLLRAGLLALAFGVPTAQALEVGKPAPAFEIAMGDGTRLASADTRGEVLVLNLWATWCTYCREEMPALEAYYQRHKGQGLRIVAVDMDDADAADEVRRVMRSFSYTAGIGRLSKLDGFGRIWRLPMTFVIDRDGVLRRDGSEGAPTVDLATLEREVTPLLGAESPPRRP